MTTTRGLLADLYRQWRADLAAEYGRARSQRDQLAALDRIRGNFEAIGYDAQTSYDAVRMLRAGGAAVCDALAAADPTRPEWTPADVMANVDVLKGCQLIGNPDALYYVEVVRIVSWGWPNKPFDTFPLAADDRTAARVSARMICKMTGCHVALFLHQTETPQWGGLIERYRPPAAPVVFTAQVRGRK